LILLLNKLDLFSEKIRSNQGRENFRRFFADYKGALEPQLVRASVRIGADLALAQRDTPECGQF
jgi:hypothetical protein